MSQNELDDFLNGAVEKRPPAARWGKIRTGDRCVTGAVEAGEILSTSKEQKREWNDGKPGELLFWDDGTKREQAIVIIQTTQIGVIDEEDDGRRTFYIEGAMRKAVAEAVKESGAPGLRVGGKLAIKCTGMEKNKAGFLAYTWVAKYVPPAPPTDEFFGDEGSTNHRGEPQPASPPDWATETPTPTRQSTLEQIRQGTAAHQAQLKQTGEKVATGFDEDEIPF